MNEIYLEIMICIIAIQKDLHTSVFRLYKNYTFNEKHHFTLYILQQHIIINSQIEKLY